MEEALCENSGNLLVEHTNPFANMSNFSTKAQVSLSRSVYAPLASPLAAGHWVTGSKGVIHGASQKSGPQRAFGQQQHAIVNSSPMQSIMKRTSPMQPGLVVSGSSVSPQNHASFTGGSAGTEASEAVAGTLGDRHHHHHHHHHHHLRHHHHHHHHRQSVGGFAQGGVALDIDMDKRPSMGSIDWMVDHRSELVDHRCDHVASSASQTAQNHPNTSFSLGAGGTNVIAGSGTFLGVQENGVPSAIGNVYDVDGGMGETFFGSNVGNSHFTGIHAQQERALVSTSASHLRNMWASANVVVPALTKNTRTLSQSTTLTEKTRDLFDSDEAIFRCSNDLVGGSAEYPIDLHVYHGGAQPHVPSNVWRRSHVPSHREFGFGSHNETFYGLTSMHRSASTLATQSTGAASGGGDHHTRQRRSYRVQTRRKKRKTVSRTEIFVEAIYFLLHVGDSGKYNLREGTVHQRAAKQVESLKNPVVPLCLSFLARHSHERRRNSSHWGNFMRLVEATGHGMAEHSSGTSENPAFSKNIRTVQCAIEKGYIGFVECLMNLESAQKTVQAQLDQGQATTSAGQAEIAGRTTEAGPTRPPTTPHTVTAVTVTPTKRENTDKEHNNTDPHGQSLAGHSAHGHKIRAKRQIMSTGYRFTHIAYQECLCGAYLAAALLGAYKSFSRSPRVEALELFFSHCNQVLTSFADPLYATSEAAHTRLRNQHSGARSDSPFLSRGAHVSSHGSSASDGILDSELPVSLQVDDTQRSKGPILVEAKFRNPAASQCGVAEIAANHARAVSSHGSKRLLRVQATRDEASIGRGASLKALDGDALGDSVSDADDEGAGIRHGKQSVCQETVLAEHTGKRSAAVAIREGLLSKLQALSYASQLRGRPGAVWWNEVVFHACDFFLRENLSSLNLFLFLACRDGRCRLNVTNSFFLDEDQLWSVIGDKNRAEKEKEELRDLRQGQILNENERIALRNSDVGGQQGTKMDELAQAVTARSRRTEHGPLSNDIGDPGATRTKMFAGLSDLYLSDGFWEGDADDLSDEGEDSDEGDGHHHRNRGVRGGAGFGLDDGSDGDDSGTDVNQRHEEPRSDEYSSCGSLSDYSTLSSSVTGSAGFSSADSPRNREFGLTDRASSLSSISRSSSTSASSRSSSDSSSSTSTSDDDEVQELKSQGTRNKTNGSVTRYGRTPFTR